MLLRLWRKVYLHFPIKTILDTDTRIACWNPVWSALVGCHLNRDILQDILAAGEWENPGDVVVEDDPYTCLPRIWGVLRKKMH